MNNNLYLDSSQTETYFNFIASIDINENTVANEMNIALNLIKSNQSEALYVKHTQSFSNIWNYGRIVVDNFELQQTIIAATYYIICSLPSLDHYGALNQFFGLSPGSLSRGSLQKDYQG